MPDGQTGISRAVELKKIVRKSEKISMISDGFALGELKSEMGDCGCD